MIFNEMWDILKKEQVCTKKFVKKNKKNKIGGVESD